MDVTSRIAGFVVSRRFEGLPAKALETAKTAVLDTLGVALAGSKEESARICAELARAEGSREEATVFGRGFRTSAMEAGFVNGTAGHAADFDHSFIVAGQPTAPVVAAAFALGEAVGATGKQVLEAYVTGFEVTAALAFAVRDAGGSGWHSNGVLGAFGAAAACARLLSLTADQAAAALAITASMASGLTANFGTMGKPLHVGLAARNGVQAAKLAQAGFTANPRTLETGNGFFDAYYSGHKIDEAPLEDLGRVYALEKYGLRLKPYPCGGLTHTAIYATIELRDTHGIAAEQVEQITVAVPQGTYNTIAFRVPETALQGKFCMGYLVARALIDGKVTLDTFTEEAIHDRRVLELLDKVEMRVDPEQQPDREGSRPATVTIRLLGDRTHSLHARFPKGSPQVPMTAAEIEAKFRDCVRGSISDQAADRAMEGVGSLETIADIRTLTELLRG